MKSMMFKQNLTNLYKMLEKDFCIKRKKNEEVWGKLTYFTRESATISVNQ